jgi:hypothetical protein
MIAAQIRPIVCVDKRVGFSEVCLHAKESTAAAALLDSIE